MAIQTPERTYRRTEKKPAGRVSQAALIRLLNADFARECEGVFAFAVYAERLADTDPAAAAVCELRGERQVAHALAVGQLVKDLGGDVAGVDEEKAVRKAGQVAKPGWSAETVRRLAERATQLRAAGRDALADRVERLAEMKRAAGDLAGLVRGRRPRAWGLPAGGL